MARFFLLLLLLSSFCCKAQREQKTAVYTSGKASDGGTGRFYCGREIAHVMGASNASWLDRNNRQQEENSQHTINKISIPDTGAIADIGAGTGYYTFQLAKKFPEGKLFAVEIQDAMIRTLEQRAQDQHLDNVTVVKGDTTSPNLPDNSVDLAMMVDVYHELSYPLEMMTAIKKALRDNGRLLLVEYKGEDPDVAIRPLHKMTIKQVNKEMALAGFVLVEKDESLPIQHYLLYKKAK